MVWDDWLPSCFLCLLRRVRLGKAVWACLFWMWRSRKKTDATPIFTGNGQDLQRMVVGFCSTPYPVACFIPSRQAALAGWVRDGEASALLSGSDNSTDLSFAASGEGGDGKKCHTKFPSHLIFITLHLSAFSTLVYDSSLFMNLYIY